MNITCDWHIHTRNSCDAACMEVQTLIAGAAEAGIADYGIADHLHTPANIADVEASRREYLAAGPSPRFHFGVEVSAVSRWELEQIAAGREPGKCGIRKGGPAGAPLAIALTDEIVERCGIEYVIGGAHWPMYVPVERDAIVREYHRQNMFLASHPLVDIVAHPWWWHGHWAEPDGRFEGPPWFDDFAAIPASMHAEFVAAAAAGGTAVEINLVAVLLNWRYPERFTDKYLDYLAAVREAGVALAIGSDCHAERYDVDFATAGELLARIGLQDDDLWRLPPRQ